MSQHALLLVLMTMPLAGCLADGAPATQSSAQQPVEHPPGAVIIDERVPLHEGARRDYTFRIESGATARLYFAVEGAFGSPVSRPVVPWCFTFDGGGSRLSQCSSGNVHVNVSPPITDQVFVANDAPSVGSYTVHFDSLPAAGTFVAFVNVEYLG